MKYYSEKLDKVFDTAEELLDAEKSTKKKTKKGITEEVVTTKEPEVPTKKQLAAEVEQADEAVKAAYADYETAKAKAEDLYKEYLAAIDALLEPAKKAVKDAEQKRYEAIRKFNDVYGAYQVTYTGARAAEELVKAINSFNSKTNRFFRDFWNF